MSKNAGITRNIHPYMLRHTCITRDSAEGMLRTHMESKHGWVKGTPMLKTYDHNGTEDLKKYLLQTLKPTEQKTRSTLQKENVELLKMQDKIRFSENKIEGNEKEIKNLRAELNDLKSLILKNSHEKDEPLLFDENGKEHVKFQEKFINVSEFDWKTQKLPKDFKLKKVKKLK